MLNFWFVFKNIFRTYSDGQKVFFPNGILATGYIIPSEEVYKRLRNGYLSLFLLAIVFILIGLALVIIFNLNLYVAILIPVIVYLVAYYAWVHVVTRDLVKVKK